MLGHAEMEFYSSENNPETVPVSVSDMPNINGSGWEMPTGEGQPFDVTQGIGDRNTEQQQAVDPRVADYLQELNRAWDNAVESGDYGHANEVSNQADQFIRQHPEVI